MGTQNVSGADEEFLQFHQPDDRSTRGDELADSSIGNPESSAMNDEFVGQLYSALQGVDADARQAFVLFTIEGFTVEEIAQITDHLLEKVRGDVSRARDFIAERLPGNNGLKAKILQHSKTA